MSDMQMIVAIFLAAVFPTVTALVGILINRNESASVRSDLNSVRSDLMDLRGEFAGIRERLARVEEKIGMAG